MESPEVADGPFAGGVEVGVGIAVARRTVEAGRRVEPAAEPGLRAGDVAEDLVGRSLAGLGVRRERPGPRLVCPDGGDDREQVGSRVPEPPDPGLELVDRHGPLVRRERRVPLVAIDEGCRNLLDVLDGADRREIHGLAMAGQPVAEPAERGRRLGQREWPGGRGRERARYVEQPRAPAATVVVALDPDAQRRDRHRAGTRWTSRTFGPLPGSAVDATRTTGVPAGIE